MEACIRIGNILADTYNPDYRPTDVNDIYRDMLNNRLHRQTASQLLYWAKRGRGHDSSVDVVINCHTFRGEFQAGLDYAIESVSGGSGPGDLLGDFVNQLNLPGLEVTDRRAGRAADQAADRVNRRTALNTLYGLVWVKLAVVARLSGFLASKRTAFNSFLLGTHPRLGRSSPVRKIAGATPVTRLIWRHCGPQPEVLGLPGPAVTPALLQANTRHMLAILQSIHQLDRHALYKMFSGREDWSTKADRMYVDFVRFFMQHLTAEEKKLLIGSVKNIIRGAQQI